MEPKHKLIHGEKKYILLVAICSVLILTSIGYVFYGNTNMPKRIDEQLSYTTLAPSLTQKVVSIDGQISEVDDQITIEDNFENKYFCDKKNSILFVYQYTMSQKEIYMSPPVLSNQFTSTDFSELTKGSGVSVELIPNNDITNCIITQHTYILIE